MTLMLMMLWCGLIVAMVVVCVWGHTRLDGWKEDTIVEYLEAKLTDKVGKPLADAEQVPRWLRALVESRH
jgi:hypothetical protein